MEMAQRTKSQPKPKSQPRASTSDEYVLPEREWDRATELIRLFVATGWINKIRPQSMLFVADPGSGKTEVLERFRGNAYLAFASDLTVRGLYTLLRGAKKGAYTHLIATEFQKFLMRKASTAENMLGALTQALEEGLGEVYIGEKLENFYGARIGLIGAITADTLSKRRDMLREVGFISRVAIFRWGMEFEELELVMNKIASGDSSDLEKVSMERPAGLIDVEMAPMYSEHIKRYVSESFRQHTLLRVFNRFRAIAMASAVLDGRRAVTKFDVSRVFAFHSYWSVMEKG